MAEDIYAATKEGDLIDQQLTGIAIAIGLLRHGGYDEAASWLHDLMTTPADEPTLDVFKAVVQECRDLEELPVPRCLD